MVKKLPAMEKTWIWSLGLEDPLEEGMATHSSILSWRIPMDRGAWWAIVHGQRSLVGYSPWGLYESDMTKPLSIAQHILQLQFRRVLEDRAHPVSYQSAQLQCPPGQWTPCIALLNLIPWQKAGWNWNLCRDLTQARKQIHSPAHFRTQPSVQGPQLSIQEAV